MDAISLSTARMVNNERIDSGQAWQLVVVGLMSNLIFKTAIVAVLGHRRLLLLTGLLFSIPFAAGVGLLILWPNP